MFNIYRLFSTPYGFYDYIWIDCTLIRETPKAILIDFDNRNIWLPKIWVARRRKRRSNPASVIPNSIHCHSELKAKNPGTDSLRHHKQPISIKISQYNWAKKAQ